MPLVNPSIEVVDSALVVPLTQLVTPTSPRAGHFDGGVYYKDGSLCAAGIQYKNGYLNVGPQEFLTPDAASFISGSHIFGGMLQNEHFGHFMVESTCRLWAHEYLTQHADSCFIFYSRLPGFGIPKFASELFACLGITRSIRIITEPTIIETLFVPTPSVMTEIGTLYGHSVVRRQFDKFSAPGQQLSPKKVYISRGKLQSSYGGLLCESVIESNLRAEGYEIVYPEQHTLAEQISIYQGASRLIFADGSALHLYAPFSRPDQRVFVVWRRKMNRTFDWQIRSFGGPHVQGEPCASALWGVEGEIDRQMVGAKAQIDFDVLGAQLEQFGFISRDMWETPSDVHVKNEVEALERQLRQPIRRFSLA